MKPKKGLFVNFKIISLTQKKKKNLKAIITSKHSGSVDLTIGIKALFFFSFDMSWSSILNHDTGTTLALLALLHMKFTRKIIILPKKRKRKILLKS